MWFRSDLRTHDNPALAAALAAGPTLACFIVSEAQWQAHDVGAPRLAFLQRCLVALRERLAALRVPLLIVRADTFAEAPGAIAGLLERHGCRALHFNAEYPLNERKRDSAVRRACAAQGASVHGLDGSLVLPPGQVLTGNGDPYTVFTPFSRRWQAELGPALRVAGTPAAQAPLELASDPVPERLGGADPTLFEGAWPGGESAARERLRAFCRGALVNYQAQRDLPAAPGTSALSAYLSVGALSPRLCFEAAGVGNAADLAAADDGVRTWLSELIWREFYRHVMAQFPHISQHQPFRRDTVRIPWRRDEADFAAWCAGRTGYPLVDAAQRQLIATGWMHNRLRMLSAMFLSKHLLIDWRWGERFFMQHLVDGDFAANNGGWQWSASTGTDAAPYFRIFNPVTQAKKFDPEGEFVKRFVPELADAFGKGLFEPWRDPQPGYPPPVVEHKAARQRALAAFKS